MAKADDLTLIYAGDMPADTALTAGNAINLVFKWAKNHKLILDAQKCEALFISSSTKKSFHSKKQLAV